MVIFYSKLLVYQRVSDGEISQNRICKDWGCQWKYGWAGLEFTHRKRPIDTDCGCGEAIESEMTVQVNDL